MLDCSIKYAPGEVVIDSDRNIRGVIFEVDDRFRGPENLLADFSGTRGPKNRPWYYLLVDGSDKIVYIPERHLLPDTSQEPVTNPLIDEHFVGFEDGRYFKRNH